MNAPEYLSIDEMIQQNQIAQRFVQADICQTDIENDFEAHVGLHRARMQDAQVHLEHVLGEMGAALEDVRETTVAYYDARFERDDKMNDQFAASADRAIADVDAIAAIPETDLHDEVIGWITSASVRREVPIERG